MPRLNLSEIEATLRHTKAQWPVIEQGLIAHGIGKKDVPFDNAVMQRMLIAYGLLDEFLARGVDPFRHDTLDAMCALNEAVHYGKDVALRREYEGAIQDNRDTFQRRIPAIYKWYARRRSCPDTAKIAAQVYVSILGAPQLFTEGNHRTGALIASWINVARGGAPPFVLSPENALAFFLPSSQIEHFSALSYWRGRHKLPRYHKAFKEFWIRQTAGGGRYLL